MMLKKDYEVKKDTSNYEVSRPLHKGKNEKVIGLIKDELGGKIMTEKLIRKTYSYLMDDTHVTKKAKGNKEMRNKKSA